MFATLIICRLFCVPISLDGGPLHLPIIQAANTIIPYKKQTMQLYLIKETINITTPVITHSEYNSTFFLAQETPADEKKHFLFFFPQRAPLPSSQDSHGTFPHLPPCWYCDADFLFDFLFIFYLLVVFVIVIQPAR